jgi:hypothetical protein
MELKAKPILPLKSDEALNSTSIQLSARGCAVTLHFSPQPKNPVMTEVKRMILSGHISTKVQ